MISGRTSSPQFILQDNFLISLEKSTILINLPNPFPQYERTGK